MTNIQRDLVSFNGDGNCEEDAARQTDVRQTIKDGIESQEDVAGEVQGDGCHEDAACKEGCVRQTEARKERGKYSFCFPEKILSSKPCYLLDFSFLPPIEHTETEDISDDSQTCCHG